MIAGWAIDITSSCGVRMMRSRFRLVIPMKSRSAKAGVMGTTSALSRCTARSLIDVHLRPPRSSAETGGCRRMPGERQEHVVE